MPYDETAAADPFDPATDTAKCYASYPVYNGRRRVQNVGRNLQATSTVGKLDPVTGLPYTWMLKHPT